MDAIKEPRLQGVAQLLVQYNLLDISSAAVYQQTAADCNQSLLQFLVSKNIICPEKIASSLARHFGMPIFDLDAIDITTIPAKLISEHLIQLHRIVPLMQQGHQLQVAMDDPGKHDALREIQFHTGLHVVPTLVESHKLTRVIQHLLQQNEHHGLAELATNARQDDPYDTASEEQPVVKFVRRIIMDAIERGASDIHFEPCITEYRIRYRLDGFLVIAAIPPLNLSAHIATRLKVMANLDISERRIPQDGRFRMQISPLQYIDFRISSCPTVCGEKIVLRILDTQTTKPDIDMPGFLPQQKQLFLKALSRKQGMILVTGPTGSGKTMTLYSALSVLNTDKKNISTVEDPVEMNIHGINQVNINPKAGLTFAGTLRAFLRQDPDVIMVGEIRDTETAEIAIKAALTGHLVLSTVHTNSAAETLTRLVNMGMPSFNIASAVSLIVAQRLVRRLCNACKYIRTDLTPMDLVEPGLSGTDTAILHSFTAPGCHQCTDGYRGRVGLFEMLPVSKTIAQMMISGKNALALHEQAKSEGMLTLYQAGLEKVREGITSLEEIANIMMND